jgi:outer membrane protein OmpA-like peptidoglycan-associated protein
MTGLGFRRFPGGYRYSRYSRYPGRGAGVLRWVVIVVLVGSGAAAYTYMHGGGTTNVPAKFIILASGTANEPRPGLPGDITQELRSAGQASANATAYVLNPNTGVATPISLTPRLPNGDVDHGPTRDAVLNASIGRVQRDLAAERAQGPFDLLTTITAAVRAVPPPATLIVVSSGLSTSGALDFRRSGWYAMPSTLAANLKAHQELSSLARYRVVFTGLGVVAGRQPALPLPAQNIVKNYWMALCQAATAASCRVDDTSRPVLPSRSEILVPRVSVPQSWTYQGPRGGSRTSLPDALLFAFDSATLLSAADSIMAPLVNRAKGLNETVSVIGTASPDGGTPAYNHTLSTRRAWAVRDRLIALGLPASLVTKVTGLGTDGQRPGACVVQGQLHENICAHLRRVVISLTPHRR